MLLSPLLGKFVSVVVVVAGNAQDVAGWTSEALIDPCI